MIQSHCNNQAKAANDKIVMKVSNTATTKQKNKIHHTQQKESKRNQRRNVELEDLPIFCSRTKE